MATPIQVGFDCVDPNHPAQFWPRRSATSCLIHPRATGAGPTSWPPRASPRSKRNSANAIVDLDGKDPRIFFQRVLQAKTVTNRLHLDLNVGGGDGVPSEERRRRVYAEVERLLEAGAPGWLRSRRRTADTSSTCGP